jgi:hypothetical protein
MISSASEGTTRHLIRDFQRFRQALEFVWPDVQRANARLRTLVICGRAGELESFAPPPQPGRPPASIVLTLRDSEQSAIVLDLATTLVSNAPASGEADLAVGQDGDSAVRFVGDRYRQLYRAYVRLMLETTQPRAPAWFEEGLAQLLMSIDITDREITVGRLEDPDAILDPDGKPTAVQDLDFNAVITRGRNVSMKELLEMPHDSAAAQNAMGNMWAKQAYAFVHWGLYGDNGKHQKAFVTFLARLAKQPLSEELFQRTFQQNYNDMGLTLRSYAEMTSHRIAGVKAEKGYKLTLTPPFELRAATEPESARLKGETLLAAGKLDAARRTMALPYRRGERDGDLLAAIGLLELRADDAKAAKMFLDLAAAQKTTRSRALVELAKLRLTDELARSNPPTARLSPPQLAAVLTPLFAARAQPSVSPELYATVARAWEKSAVNPEPAHLVVLDEGVRLFPRDADLVYRTAALKARIGLHADAAALIELGLRNTADTEALGRFKTLQATLPRTTQ